VWAIQKFKPFVWGAKILIVTDHHALCWLMKKRNLSGRLARWSLALQEYDIEIVHRSGRLHYDADALSRLPVGPPEEEPDDLIPMLIQLPTGQHLGTMQEAVPQWRRIIQLLRQPELRPKERRLTKGYAMEEGKLVRKTFIAGQLRKRVCLPPGQREEVLRACHDDLISGHLGVDKTLKRIRTRFFWPKMLETVLKYVQSCRSCQSRKRPLKPIGGPMQPLTADNPFERVGVDLLGPLPKTKDGNKYIIVAVDYFTKWAITRALPKATTVHVVDFFIKEIFLQHGAPLQLISDRGKCLKNNFTKELFAALQVERGLCSPYRPQTNGLVERLNHTLAMMLSMYVRPQHDDWDKSLHYVTFAYNTAQQSSIGCSPFFALYGREPLLPLDLTLGLEKKQRDQRLSHEEAVDKLLQDLQEARSWVRAHTPQVHARQKARHDARHAAANYAIGDLVMLYTPFRKVGRATKLLHRYTGPYRVLRKMSEVTVKIGISKKKSHPAEVVHVSRLKLFHGR